MDQIKIGKFIAELRKEKKLTQETLGEALGVTNKTVSRWECGTYMPDIEMLGLLAKEFGVSINELLAGQRLNDEEFRQAADENLSAVSKESIYSLKERTQYFKTKWRRDHRFFLVLLFLIFLAALTVPFFLHKPYLLGCVPMVGVIEYVIQYNRMMIYVENHLYGVSDIENASK